MVSTSVTPLHGSWRIDLPIFKKLCEEGALLVGNLTSCHVEKLGGFCGKGRICINHVPRQLCDGGFFQNLGSLLPPFLDLPDVSTRAPTRCVQDHEGELDVAMLKLHHHPSRVGPRYGCLEVRHPKVVLMADNLSLVNPDLASIVRDAIGCFSSGSEDKVVGSLIAPFCSSGLLDSDDSPSCFMPWKIKSFSE